MSGADHEVHVPNVGLGQAASTLLAVAEVQGYDVTASGPNRFRLTRTLRPWWANTLAVVLAPLLGIGLLFLRVRRTETCDGIIIEERRGVRVHLTELRDPAVFAALHAAFAEHASRAAVAPRPTAFSAVTDAPAAAAPPRSGPDPGTPPQPVAPAAGVTPAPSAAPTEPWRAPSPDKAPTFDRTLTLAQLAAMRSRAAPALRLPDGRVVPVDAGLVVGRGPEPNPEMPSAELLAISDASLSKTHASFGPSADGVWVQDHGSTNGTTVVVQESTARCHPGARVNVPIGAVVELGEVRIEVVAAGS